MIVTDFRHKLSLGTVQLGLNYGVSNRSGQVSREVAKAILSRAKQVGVDTLDTARGYGDSEAVLGEWARSVDSKSLKMVPHVVSKIPTLQSLASEKLSFETAVESLLLDSAKNLAPLRMDAVLLHRDDDLTSADGDLIWARVKAATINLGISRIGVSSYDPNQLRTLLKQFPIKIVQVPFNCLDWRFLTGILHDELQAAEVEVHVRSVFLQGLFFMGSESCPSFLPEGRAPLLAVEGIARNLNLTVPQLSLALAIHQPLIRKVVFGVTSISEFDEILTWPCKPIPKEAIAEIQAIAANVPARMIDPRQWPKL